MTLQKLQALRDQFLRKIPVAKSSLRSFLTRVRDKIRDWIDPQRPMREAATIFGRVRRLAFRQQLDEFIDWLDQGPPARAGELINLAEFQIKQGQPGNQNMAIEEFALRALANTSAPRIEIDQNSEGLCSTIPKWPKDIYDLKISLSGRDSVGHRIEDKWIWNALVAYNRPIRFSNCRIATLTVHRDIRINLQNCFIDKIKVDRDSGFEDLHIEGGCLFHPQAPPFGGTNPNLFKGRVTVRQLYIPRRKDYLHKAGTDEERAFRMYECRNFRNYLSANNNLLAAGRFHAAELALERADEPRISKGINWLYEFLSDYGNSIQRPLWWFVAAYLGLAAIVLVFDSVKPTTIEGELFGWRHWLQDSRLLRALVYPFYAIFNPLNVFTARPLMVSATPLSAFVHSVVSLFGTLNIGLLVLAIRRRFKLE